MHETLTFLHTSSTPPGSAKAVEERDYQFGRLFGLFALLRSGKLLQPTSSVPKAAAIFAKAFTLALGLIERPYIRESAGWLVLEMLRGFDAASASLDWADEGRKAIREGIFGAAAGAAVKAWTPEKIAWTVYMQSNATVRSALTKDRRLTCTARQGRLVESVRGGAGGPEGRDAAERGQRRAARARAQGALSHTERAR